MAILENAQMILNRTASESISAVIESSLMPTNFSSQTHSNTNQSSKSSSSNNKISQQQSVQNSDQLSSGYVFVDRKKNLNLFTNIFFAMIILQKK